MAEDTGAPTPEVTKTKKLVKSIEGNVLTIKEGATGKTLTFDFTKLPAAIQAKLGPYGLSQKLGDAAAGKAGTEAVESIETVWKGLTEGNWSVRAPAGEKVSKKEIEDKLAAMPEKDRKIAEAMLAKMGISFGPKAPVPTAGA